VAGDVPPRLYLAVVSSCLATGLIAWSVADAARGARQSLRSELNQLLAISAAVVVANAAMSYVYTKHEIVSVAGCFYAVAAFAAARHALERLREPAPAARRVVLVALLACTATLWAARSAGVHHMLRVEAFRVRNDWAGIPAEMWREDANPDRRDQAALIRQLRADAINAPGSNPYLVPRWVDRWLGE
jgi:hypothetical protein